MMVFRLFEFISQCREGGVAQRGALHLSGGTVGTAILLHPAGMLVIVAVDAEQFPVAAVGGIVVVVVVDMVHGEFAELFSFEFTGAASAHQREQFQGLFPVSRLACLLFLAHFGDQAIPLFGILVVL